MTYCVVVENSSVDERTFFMPFTVLQIPEDDKVCHHTLLHVLHQLYSPEVLGQTLTQCHAWEERERDLNMLVVCYLLIGLHLFPHLSQEAVLRELSSSTRLLWPDPSVSVPGKSAISYRRKQLRATPLRRLFRQMCRPMATPQTKGAFALGRRVMAIDATLDNVVETDKNRIHFGRTTESPVGRSPFPQVRCAYLSEWGTHAIVDAVLAPCRHSEEELVPEVLRSITSDMLVTMDRGVFSCRLVEAIGRTGAHVLARLSSNHLVEYDQQLADGSFLVHIAPGRNAVQGPDPLVVRVIEYHISDPDVPDAFKTHRLLTTLVDPKQAPCADLVELYHERWEIEGVIDEHKTQMRLAGRTLRSQTPQGVYQELYGLLLAHYAVRSFMHESALQADVDPDRLSFSQAVETVGRAVQEFALVPVAQHHALKARLLHDLRTPLLPARRLRFQARLVKRATSKYSPKRVKTFWSFAPKGVKFRDLVLLERAFLI